MNPVEIEPEVDAVVEFDRLPAIAHVETDRFCDGCGYNLRTQPVRREARTRLLLCRCPECGRFHSVGDATTAGRVWLGRLGTLALFFWVVTVIGSFVGLGAAQIGLSLVPLEELTSYRQVSIASSSTQPVSGANPTSQISSTTTVISGGRIIITGPGGTSTSTYRRVVREPSEHDAALIALLRGLSFVLGFVLATLTAIFLHHWRRWCYVGPVLVVSAGAAALTLYGWNYDYPHLVHWAIPHVVAHAVSCFAGGLVGILFGRAFARLLLTIILPPRVRQVLAFLWLVDGKQPPAATTRA